MIVVTRQCRVVSSVTVIRERVSAKAVQWKA